MSRQQFPIHSIVRMALFAAILAISAYISIPLPLPGGPHLTLQNFMLLLIALLLSWQESLLVVVVWMLLGIIGVPVFIGGKASVGYLLNPWGGYTIAFLVVALLLPLFRGKKYHRIRYTLVSVAGVILIDFFGMLYLHFYPASGYADWKLALTVGFAAFLPLDLVKAVAAAQMVPAFRRIIGNRAG